MISVVVSLLYVGTRQVKRNNMTTFVISDTHFSHKNIVTFTTKSGEKVRPWDNVEEMDEELVHRWNSVVGPKDKVYHLGDVAINKSALPILSRLNGDKVLIKGNHDIYKLNAYTPYFRDIRACLVLKDFILTHIPVHESQLDRFKMNIHGHLHTDKVRLKDLYRTPSGLYTLAETTPDPRYKCVCVEQTNYYPVPLDEIVSKC